MLLSAWCSHCLLFSVLFWSSEMAGVGTVQAVFRRHRVSLLRELSDSNVLSILVKRKIISIEDEEYITNVPDTDKKCEFFIDIITKQTLSNFSEFCNVIEKECPSFVNEILSDQQVTPTQGVNLLETFKDSMVQECNINRENSSPRCRRSLSVGGTVTPVPNSQRCSMSPEHMPPLNHTIELYTEPVVEDDDGSSSGGGGSGGAGSGWETHRVSVSRVPGYGFGIAVSGGRDNPHFASGDPSIAVSDVIKDGPAEELLQVNDRIISVNGISVENVDYATAVQVLRDSGNTVSLVIRRRTTGHLSNMNHQPPTPFKVTLTKASKKEDFGVVLGCKLFIKELSPKARDQINSAGQGLCEGDFITRINNAPCGDVMSLKEAKKLIESCKDRLSLVVIREQRGTNNNNNTSGFHDSTYHNNIGSEMQNSYSGQNLYVAPPSRSTLVGEERGNTGSSGGRSRGPLPPSASPPPHQDPPNPSDNHIHPPRPPPPRPEDYYSSRRQLYEEDPLSQRNKPAGEPRLISFQKEGSVGLRLTGGNQVGIFVSAVQPGSPASLQGLTPGDNILKINEMDMKGVTREEAVLFLLSLQDQIDLIVQHSPDEYQAIAAQQKGDSFHIKCHFHYTEPTKGEMSFRSGDVFHVIDTLHNGTVGAWQVFRIGRNNQEVQKGIIPNKSRAEELATAQFNASKKELSTGNSESRGSFFRRRRSTHRRSKSLGKEHWDDVVFSDSISKFPAYERVVLKHPGFVRPVVLFGPVADLAREKLLRDFSDKFTAPQLDNTMDDGKSKSTSGIIRLSGIRAIMERGKHALLDITPNAVDRLNYAQFYPVVIFLKADNKTIIKQLRQGMPKSAHKSSKKLLEHCQKMDRIWSHIFTQTINLNEATVASWYPKLSELIQRSQAQQLWISETKRSEPLSDDFLFPMSTTESRLSYASSPESDVETSVPEGRLQPRMLRASSDPSVATQQDTLDRGELNGGDMAPPPPPYTSGYGDSKYGFSANSGSSNPLSGSNDDPSHMGHVGEDVGPYSPPKAPLPLSPPQSPQGMYGHVPELPPRIDRGVKPPGGVLLPGPTPGRNPPALRHHSQNNSRPSAQERLFGTPRNSSNLENGTSGSGTGGPGTPERQNPNAQGSLDRYKHQNNTNSYDSMSSYDSYAPGGHGNASLSMANSRLGPNAPDDLKVGPRTDSNTYEAKPIGSPQHRHSGLIMDGSGSPGQYSGGGQYGGGGQQYNGNGLYGAAPPQQQAIGSPYGGQTPGVYGRNNVPPPQGRPHHNSGDYSKYGSPKINSTNPGDYNGSVGKAGGAAFYKPVPPPKPKHYRPPPMVGNAEPPPPPHHTKSYSMGNGGMEMNGRGMHGGSGQMGGHAVQNGYGGSPSRGGPGWQQSQQQQAQHAHSMSHPYHHPHQQSVYGGQGPPQSPYNGPPQQVPPYNGPPPHVRSPPHANSAHVIDLAGSREQRGSAFELYRKPQHMHQMSSRHYLNDGMDSDMSNATPKPKKKLSRKTSFLRSITIDLFRSKSKKVSKHHSVCENDLQNLSKQSALRREHSDISNINPPSKSRGLFRSNSSCEAKPLKPILKRQTSFTDRNGYRGPFPYFNENSQMRRQNSLCEMETEPKLKPFLKRQNSLIEYNRRGLYDYQFKPFNMITTIDPVYQRRMELKHEPFYPGKDMSKPNDPIYGAIPKPERIYATRSESRNMTESPYANRPEILKKQAVCPYSSRQEVIQEQFSRLKSEEVYVRKEIFSQKTYENPYAARREVQRQRDGLYASRQECCVQENPYGVIKHSPSEAPYASRSEIARQNRSSMQNPYSTKEELLKYRSNNGENLYGTKEEMLKHRISGENPYASRGEMNRQRLREENPYGSRQEIGRFINQVENPYQSKEEMLRQRLCSENAYNIREHMVRQRSSYESSTHTSDESAHNRQSAENPYGTKSENMRNRQFAESPYCTKSENMHHRQSVENPYGTKSESMHNRQSVENPYGTKSESMHNRQSVENPYGTKLENMRNRQIVESPYGTKSENIHNRQSDENPYGTKLENMHNRQSADNPYYGAETENMQNRQSVENPYSTKSELNHREKDIDNNSFASKEGIGISNNNCSTRKEDGGLAIVDNLATLKLGESVCKTKGEVEHCDLSRESAYSPRLHVKPLTDIPPIYSGSPVSTPSSEHAPCICEDISTMAVMEPCCSKQTKESPYVSKQEILSQKAALQASRELNKTQGDDKFEVIRLRNQAKKEQIYQSRKELGIDTNMNRDPIYVSKRELKDAVIYEIQNESKDDSNTSNQINKMVDQSYELSEVAHLSRRDTKNIINNQAKVDFDSLRNQPKTDQEKQNNLIYESKILHGEPLYQSRLPPKIQFGSGDCGRSADPTLNSATSMETHYESECSMQFEYKPQSTPYTSQDIGQNESVMPIFKCNNKSTTFANSSGEGHDTTVVPGPLMLDTEVLAVGQKGKIGGPDGPCTTWGIFDSEGGILEDRSWGVSLIIPPDAILPGVKQKIYFTVSDPRHTQTTPGPPIDMDKGEALLSPLVMCGPQGLGFARPVTLRLPHCANTLPSLGLTLNATDTEPNAQPSWDNILLPATTTLNTVAVKVDHF